MTQSAGMIGAATQGKKKRDHTKVVPWRTCRGIRGCSLITAGCDKSSRVNSVVKTRCGEVRGSVADGVHTFKGVSYAAPPFGRNRLQPPRPVEPWSVRDALAFGPTPPQPSIPPPLGALIPTFPGEDCLNLNIWSRDLGSVRAPVMVRISGGGFESGSSAIYDGSRFARDGVVCVTINYRLGADGFLHLGDGISNLGLLDQIAALEWVRENIAAFGGDPGNVTIFGESSGAMSVGTLLAMPRAGGLFRRGIMESGAGHQVLSAETARQIGRDLAEKLGVAPMREAIAAIPVDRLLAAQTAVAADLAAHPDPRRWGGEPGARVSAWQPVVDGEVISARPIDRIVAGAGADIDVLVGTNAEEGRLSLVPTGALSKVTDEVLAQALADYGLPVESALAAYRKAYLGASAGDLLAALQTDWYYRIPAIQLADAHADSASATYMYEFAWRSPQYNGLLGACHALEIPFVLDILEDKKTQLLTGPHAPQQLADTVHAAWAAFATKGDTGWPRYDLSRRATLRFNTTSEVVNDPRPFERALWDGVR